MALPTTANVARPRSAGYDALIDELYVRLAVAPDRQLSIQPAQTQAQRISTAQTSEDFLPEAGVVFSRNDFTGGEGLAYAHRANAGDNDATRYWDSRGLDVSEPPIGELPSVRLLHDTEEDEAEASLTLMRMTQLPDGKLLYTAGSSVRLITTPLSASTPSTEDPHTGTQPVLDVAVLGDEAYAACGTDGTGKRNSAGTWSDLGATQTDRIWSAKRRLIGLNGSIVVEVNTTTGAHTTLLTLPSGIVANDVIEAGPVILIAASNGYIYSVKDDGGTLALQSESRISKFEEPVAIAYRAGAVLVSTRAAADDVAGTFIGRLYAGELAADTQAHALQGLRLIKEFGVGLADSIDHSLTQMYVARDAIFALGQWDATETHLWRYSLSKGGISRDLVFGQAGEAQGLEVVGGFFFAAIEAGANSGLWRESTTTVPSGWIITPAADHFTAADKQWLGFRMNVGDLGLGGSVAAKYTTNPDNLLDNSSSGWLPISTIYNANQNDNEVTFSHVESRYIAVQLIITAEPTLSDDGPTAHSFAVRAETFTDEHILTMPVNVSDRIEPPNRKPYVVPGWGDVIYNELLGREGKTATVTILRTGMIFRGVVQAVVMPAQSIAKRGSLTAYAQVTIRGKQITQGGDISGDGVLGVGLLGIGKLGVD